MAARHILISLEPRHAESILAGRKSVELRRRTMHIEPGTVVWLYAKAPVSAVLGFAIAGVSKALSPTAIWAQFSKAVGLTRDELFEYLEGVSMAFALPLRRAHRLQGAVSLKSLRQQHRFFQPPQFFSHLDPDGSLVNLLSEASNQAWTFEG
jgi:predicted transcriptional regulator